MGHRLRNTVRTIYLCIDEIEGVNPRTEFAVGNLDQIKEIGKQYEPANKRKSKCDYWRSPFVMLYFKNKGKDHHGYAKVAIPRDHEDVDRALLEYINEVKTELVNHIKQHDPGCAVRGAIAVRGSEDNVILDMLKKYVRLEEAVKYKI